MCVKERETETENDREREIVLFSDLRGEVETTVLALKAIMAVAPKWALK